MIKVSRILSSSQKPEMHTTYPGCKNMAFQINSLMDGEAA